MKRITISLDVTDEDHENVLRLVEGCANRIAYNHPRIGAIRWLDDSSQAQAAATRLKCQ